jgi:hypothetical protein
MLDTNEALRPFGEHPIGYLQYSPGGHMVVFLQTGTPKRAAGTAYTDAGGVDIYKGIIGAYAGTYSVEGNKVIHHIVASWFPEWDGGDQTRYAAIEGNRLTIKTAPLKSPLDGRAWCSHGDLRKSGVATAGRCRTPAGSLLACALQKPLAPPQEQRRTQALPGRLLAALIDRLWPTTAYLRVAPKPSAIRGTADLSGERPAQPLLTRS